ncbi:MAG: accessory gene regulator B family protein [Lachnospiraceae bacterium]|nr:accessory gene regulator B family protein [Lachnospiraceae bacterium]
MFKNISEKITNQLLRTDVIEYDDFEIYQFGLEQLLSTGLNILTTIILGIVVGEFWKGILFVFAFMMLRTYAGGYHSSTTLRCYLLTVSIIAAVLSVIKYVRIDSFICIGLLIISSVIILVLTPVESKNKPLDSIECVVYRRKAVIIWCIETMCTIVFMAIGFKEAAISIIMGFIVLGISQIVGVIQAEFK